MTTDTPHSIDDLRPEHLNRAARRLLRDDAAQVTALRMGQSEPFEYPKFGDKRFDVIEFDYTSPNGSGSSRMILRRRPSRDAVSTLIGDLQHRELLAFTTGLLDELPPTFHHPYLDVMHDEAHEQHWAFLEDVSDDIANIGIVDTLPDEKIRTILSHLAAFHAKFWERPDLREKTFPSPKRDGVSWAPAKEAGKIEKLRDKLDTAIADVVREVREAQGTLADKNAASRWIPRNVPERRERVG